MDWHAFLVLTLSFVGTHHQLGWKSSQEIVGTMAIYADLTVPEPGLLTSTARSTCGRVNLSLYTAFLGSTAAPNFYTTAASLCAPRQTPDQVWLVCLNPVPNTFS